MVVWGFGFWVGAFNRALWCLSFVSGISLSADLSVLGFAGGLGSVLSLSRSPRLGPSGLIGLPKEAAVLATVLLRSYVLFCFVPLLSGAAFSGRRAVDLRSTYAVSLVTGFEPFPCSSTCLSRQCSGPVRSHALLSERQRDAASHRRPRQSGAWGCSRPPWRSGPDVSHHPRGVPGPYPRTL